LVLIAVDIGNSKINIGYFTEMGLLVQQVETNPLRGAEEYRRLMDDFMSRSRIEKKRGIGGIISSVVLSHNRTLQDALKKLTEEEDAAVMIVDFRMETGLNLKVDEPDKLGTDRIADAVAADALYLPPVAVADFGTATTITAVDREHNLIGGSIMPGLGLMNSALGREAYLLHEVALEPPVSALGADTEGCIRAGLYFGTAGAVERILSEIEKEAGCPFRLVLTGGHALAMDRFITRQHEVNPELTLEGLRILYGKNRSS
jgi:type III pantothenate kinase